MTSPSGAMRAKGLSAGKGGVSDVTIMFAVDVGERCIVNGYRTCTLAVGLGLYDGFGRALTWNSRLDSRKLACSSMTTVSQ